MSDIDLEGLEAQWQQRRELLSGFQGDLALNVSITEVFKGAAIHEGKTLPLMALRKPGEEFLHNWQESVVRPLQEASDTSNGFAGRLKEARSLAQAKADAQAELSTMENRKESASVALVAALDEPQKKSPRGTPRGTVMRAAQRAVGMKSEKGQKKPDDVEKASEELTASAQAVQEAADRLKDYSEAYARLATVVSKQYPAMEKFQGSQIRQAVGAAAELLATWAEESKEASGSMADLAGRELRDGAECSQDESTNTGNESSNTALSGSSSENEEGEPPVTIDTSIPTWKLERQVRQSAEENDIRQKSLPWQLRRGTVGKSTSTGSAHAIEEASIKLLANDNDARTQSIKTKRCPRLPRKLRRLGADMMKETAVLESLARCACGPAGTSPMEGRGRTARRSSMLSSVGEMEELKEDGETLPPNGKLSPHVSEVFRPTSAMFGYGNDDDPTQQTSFMSEGIPNDSDMLSPFAAEVGGRLEERRERVGSSSPLASARGLAKDSSPTAQAGSDGKRTPSGWSDVGQESREGSSSPLASARGPAKDNASTPRGGSDGKRTPSGWSDVGNFEQVGSKGSASAAGDHEDEPWVSGAPNFGKEQASEACNDQMNEPNGEHESSAAPEQVDAEVQEIPEAPTSAKEDVEVPTSPKEDVDAAQEGDSASEHSSSNHETDDSADDQPQSDLEEEKTSKGDGDASQAQPTRQDSLHSSASSEAKQKGKSLFGISCCMGSLPRRRSKGARDGTLLAASQTLENLRISTQEPRS